MKLYTKGGDSGTTSLIGGERVPKYDLRVEAYGSVDELSAQIAMLRDMLSASQITEFDKDLTDILGSLMHVESLLAIGSNGEGKVKDLPQDCIKALESRIDAVSETLPPLQYFTIPGGHITVSQAHICRTVCRRAERHACRAAAEYPVSPTALIYINRLSDFMYVISRRLTMLLNVSEIKWIP